MTDAEKMREAAALLPCPFCGGRKITVFDNLVLCDSASCGAYGPDLGHCVGPACRADSITAWNTRALPIPVDASAPAADCQQAGLVTVGAPQITIRHGRNNDPYPEGWTLCVADNSVTYKRGGHMDIYTIEKGFLAFAARKEVMPDADQIGDSKPATSPGVTAGAAGLLDEVKAALALLTERARGLVFAHHHGNGLEGWHNTVDGVDRAITAAQAALARLEREVG